MPHGQPQRDQADAVPAPAAVEPEAVPLMPAVAPESAVPFGARSPQEVSGTREALALPGAGERRRFVLQLQRTAGNAAVGRWLGAARERYAGPSGDGGGPEPPPGGPDEPPDMDAPRPR